MSATHSLKPGAPEVMHLKVLLPARVLVDENVKRIVAEGRKRRLRVAAAAHRLSCRIEARSVDVPGRPAAGRGSWAMIWGILVKRGAEVLVSTQKAVVGTDLAALRSVIEREFKALDERERTARAALARLEAGMVRRFMELEERGVTTMAVDADGNNKHDDMAKAVGRQAERKQKGASGTPPWSLVRARHVRSYWLGCGGSHDFGDCSWNMARCALANPVLMDHRPPVLGRYSWLYQRLVVGSARKRRRMNTKGMRGVTWMQIVLYVSAGAVLGCLYLGGLWLTVMYLKHAESPLSLLAVSASMRLLLLLAALALVSGLDGKRLIACVAGFAVARLIVSLWPRTQPAQRASAL